MSKHEVNNHIHDLFQKMNVETTERISNSVSFSITANNIVSYITNTIAIEIGGYISTLYKSLSKETLAEPFFVDPDHANQFYESQIERKIRSKYIFNPDELPIVKKGIDFNEINRNYASAVAGAGTASISGILLWVLSESLDITVVGIIAGAVLLGLFGAGIAYWKAIPDINQHRFTEATHRFLSDLENEMYCWVDGIVAFYNNEVEELKKNCEDRA